VQLSGYGLWSKVGALEFAAYHPAWWHSLFKASASCLGASMCGLCGADVVVGAPRDAGLAPSMAIAPQVALIPGPLVVAAVDGAREDAFARALA
jgi:hypothetical protein